MKVEAQEAVEAEAFLAPIATGLGNDWLYGRKVRSVQ